jgi:hypothetical protein
MPAKPALDSWKKSRLGSTQKLHNEEEVALARRLTTPHFQK